MIALLLALLLGTVRADQAVYGDLIRINPTGLPATCSTGDLRIDMNAGNALKLCVLNVWSSILPLTAPTAISLGGVFSQVPVSHNFMTGINTSGAPTLAQPAFTDLSGAATAAQLPSTITVGDGTQAAPGLAFTSETGSGLYRLGAGDVALAVTGTLGIEAIKVGSNINLGFGAAASNNANSPLNVTTTNNGAAFFAYTNNSSGAASGTVFQIGNGPSANTTTIENWAYLSSGYLSGGSALFANPNQTQMVFGCEYSLCYDAFTVGGRTLATERMRLNATNLTLNKGTNLVLSGATSGALTMNAGATGSYGITWPTAQGANLQTLQNDGSGNLTWVTPAAGAPVVPFSVTTSSTGSAVGYIFTITSATTAAGCVYSNNGHNYTVKYSIAPGTTLYASQASAPTSSGTLTYVSGGAGCSGTGNITYSAEVAYNTITVPTSPSPLYGRIRIVGGGGGGDGSGTSPGTANAGTTSYFSDGVNYIVSCTGGGIGVGGAGGSCSGGNISMPGNPGGGRIAAANAFGGVGGASPFGGGGLPGSNGPGNGGNAAGYGSGGGGAGDGTLLGAGSGIGGAAGGYTEVLVTTLPATFSYAIGTGGTGATLGTSGAAGGNGHDGVIYIEWFYQ